MATVPPHETQRLYRRNAGVGVSLRLIGATLREQYKDHREEILFHWRLKEPLLVWRNQANGRFVKAPPWKR